MSLIVNRKNDRVTGSLNGNPFNILFDEDGYESLKVLSGRLEQSKNKEEFNAIVSEAQGLLEVDFNSEVASVNGYLKYLSNVGTYHLVLDKGTKNESISDIAIPQNLVDMITESYEDGNDYMPILLAWARFITLDDKGSLRTEEDIKFFAEYLSAEFVDHDAVEVLMEEQGITEEVARLMCTYQDIAITNYGLLATYKVVERVKKIWKLEKDKNDETQKVQVDAFPSTETIDPITGEVTKTEGEPKFLEEITFTPAIWKDGHKFYSDSKLGYSYKIGEEAVLPEEAPRNYSNDFGGGGLSVAA